MALSDIFKFRESPESETAKPFLEHLEDLRWTVVKMAITLVLAMIVCFGFRSLLVRVMQAPLHNVDPQVGALKALGTPDSFGISFTSPSTPELFFPFHCCFTSSPDLFFPR